MQTMSSPSLLLPLSRSLSATTLYLSLATSPFFFLLLPSLPRSDCLKSGMSAPPPTPRSLYIFVFFWILRGGHVVGNFYCVAPEPETPRTFSTGAAVARTLPAASAERRGECSTRGGGTKTLMQFAFHLNSDVEFIFYFKTRSVLAFGSNLPHRMPLATELHLPLTIFYLIMHIFYYLFIIILWPFSWNLSKS